MISDRHMFCRNKASSLFVTSTEQISNVTQQQAIPPDRPTCRFPLPACVLSFVQTKKSTSCATFPQRQVCRTEYRATLQCNNSAAAHWSVPLLQLLCAVRLVTSMQCCTLGYNSKHRMNDLAFNFGFMNPLLQYWPSHAQFEGNAVSTVAGVQGDTACCNGALYAAAADGHKKYAQPFYNYTP